MNAAATFRVLLVDDDEDDYERTKEVLDAIPHSRELVFDWISSSEAARKAVRRERYDVCLLDYFLGVEHGLTFLTDALRDGVTTPFVLLTGRGDRAIEQAALAAGACDYLAKHEVAPATLERAIRHAMERGSMLAALRGSERRFRAVFEHAHDAILLTNDDGRYVDGNPAALELLGVTRGQLLEMHVFDTTPDASSSWHELLTRGSLEGEIALHRPGGEPRLAEFNAVAGVLPGLHLSVLRDVTERTHARRALHHAQNQLVRSERRFRAMIEKGEDGISLLDASLRSVYQSPSVEAISGYSADELGQMEWVDFVDEAHRPRLEQAIGQVLAAPGSSTEVEFDLRRADGALRTLALRAQNLLDDPDIGAVITNFRDITDRKNAERQRDGFFELSLDLLCVAGFDGRYRKLNPAWQQMLGWSPDELTARPFLDFVHPDDRPATELEFARLIEGQRTIAFENRYRTRDGRYRWLRWTANTAVEDGLVYATARDVTEERAGAERDRLLFARSPSPKWLLDAAGSRVLDVNEAAIKLLGYSREELLALDARNLFEEERGGLELSRSRLRAKHGGVYDVEVTAQLLDLPAGPAILEVLRDVTERKRVQAELRDSEHRYRRIVENTSEGVWIYDGQGVTRFMNGQMAGMLGTTLDEAVGQPIFQFMDDNVIDVVRDRLDHTTHERAERREFRLKRRDGSVLWISSHTDPLFDAYGRFESTVALVTDITELRQSEQEGRRLAAIVESSRDAILSCDEQGLIRSWNSAAVRLTQYSASETIGRPVSMLFPDPQVALEEGVPNDPCERSLRRKDSSIVEVSLSSSTLPAGQGEVGGTSLIIRDVSERRKAEAALRRTEEQLRQAQKMEAIGSLAGGVAHDFRNLLTVILSYADMIIEDLEPSDPMRGDLDEIRRAGFRANELTRQLLAFSRKQILQPRVLDVNDVVRGVQKMLERVLGEDVELCLALLANLAMVNADAGQLEQVIMNLVVNARDAMPEGGSLTIETSVVAVDDDRAENQVEIARGRYVTLAVTDTGVGMNRETQARIFEPFFTTKDPGKGTGLGLSTVYGIVQQSGGHVVVRSEPGRGTTFTIYLPHTSRTRQTTSIPSVGSLYKPGGETILLVEDEPQLRQVIRTLLVKHGYNVFDATNAGEALLICEQYGAQIDLLLTDVVMPRMNGHALAERLVSKRPAMKVLFMSGYTENTITHHGVLDEGVEFLAKPITPELLLRKLGAVLGQRPAS